MPKVIIDVMEMPKSCYLCRYHVNDICEIAGHRELQENWTKERASWCPLQEVKE